MATLHLISSQLRPESELWQQLQAALMADDSLLFMGSALYSLAMLPPISQAIYVLQSDLAATGFQPAAPVNIIDYDGFVSLGVRHERSLSWN